jgi:hypothetical protein
MLGQARDRRWPGRGPGAFTIGAVAAAAVAITSAAWPMSGSLAATRSRSPGPIRSKASVLYAKPPRVPSTRWTPVPFQRAQLSVPRDWFVESKDFFSCYGKSAGMIFAGIKPHIPKSGDCDRTTNFAWIVPAGHIPPGISHRKPTAVINGLPVYRVPSPNGSVVYLVPRLGVRVGAHGRLAKRVLATLNRSALAAVLAKGPDSPVPAHWVGREFGGVKFATPRGFQVSRAIQWATCGTGVDPHSLDLINAKKPPAALPCPYPLATAGGIEAVHGLTVVTGKFAAKSVAESYRRCELRSGTRICLSTGTGAGGLLGSVLIFSVSKPGHHPRTFLLLGLPATGAQARAIFDSISVR